MVALFGAEEICDMQTISATVRDIATRSIRVLVGVAIVGLIVAQAAPAGAASLPVRTKGFPVSANGASSMHVAWAEDSAPVKEVSTVLEVLDAPSVQELYFWALEVTFVDRAGRPVGEAHLGLQWFPKHPGSTAVNFGGYDEGVRPSELSGEGSHLPSSTGDPNTRDYAWQTGHRYKLRIFGAGDGWWSGEVSDLESGDVVMVRRLFGGGSRLARPVVWSEVFARCDDPTSTVRWSSFSPRPAGMQVTYQSFNSGGCTNTTTQTDSRGILQRTNTTRTVRDYEVLRSGW